MFPQSCINSRGTKSFLLNISLFFSYYKLRYQYSAYEHSPGCSPYRGRGISSGHFLWLVLWTGKQRIVLLSSQRWQKIICFVYLHSSCTVMPLKALPRAAVSPLFPTLFVFLKPLSFGVCEFCFSSVWRGNLLSLYLQDCIWGNWFLSKVTQRAGSHWLRGKANVI